MTKQMTLAQAQKLELDDPDFTIEFDHYRSKHQNYAEYRKDESADNVPEWMWACFMEERYDIEITDL